MDYPVEIKLNVEPPTIDDALAALGLRDSDAEPRAIYFCAAQDGQPGWGQSGVVLRLRRDADSADSTLKFRPCREAELPPRWATPSEGGDWTFRIEHDWAGGREPVLSSSLVTTLDGDETGSALANRDVSSLFSTDQRGLFADYAGFPLNTTDVRVLGPVRARKWKTKLGGRKINCEEWVVGDELRFLELSDREDDPARAAQTRRELLTRCKRLRVHISTVPELKTQLAMDYFSRTQAAS